MLARARAVAAAVPDPELPFVTVEDLGILRAVNLRDGKIFADVSPTYSGCPAVAVIEQSIEQALRDAGFDATVRRVMSPAWTTDWITDNGRRKLQQNGIAPPAPGNHAKPALFASTVVECPLCQSKSTEKISEFGSTPCKAQYRCNTCREPFDYFKCL
jgi:ring-1,2-phenylacetyl-CoA epoxidase subunit PaaD